MCGVSASLFGRSGGSGAVIVRYSYTSSGDSPVLGGVTVRSADGGHRAVLTGFVIAFGSAESATVTLKLWPTADATSVQTRSVVVPSTQTDAFVQAVGGLVPGTSYSYEVYVDSSNKVEGTVVLENGNPGISTTAASAQSVSGSSFEKYLVLPTGTNDFTVAGGYVDMLVVGGGGAGGFGGNGAKDGGSAGGGGGGVLHVGRKYFSHGTYRAVVGAGGRKMTSKSSSEGWGQLSSVSLVSATDTIAYYGAGGGGGTGGSATAQLPGLGGSGLGGLGYDYTHNTVEAGSGAAGTGSGGGGGGSGKTSGGAGGDGTVILRYFDGSSLAGRGLPLVAWTPEQYVPTVSSLSFNVSVPFVGIGCDGVSLSARYWTDAEDCGDVSKATTVVLNANFMDPETREFTLTGLSPARTYFVQVLATNASGSDISSTYEMRTLQSLGEKMTRTQSQAYNTFTYSVGSLATGVSTLKLMASQDGGETWQQLGESWTATVGDSLQVSHNLLDGEGFAFGVSTKCKLVMENSDPENGVPASTCETDVLSFTLTDEALYTWSDEVSDGRWDDVSSWTCNLDGYSVGYSLGYPVAGSTVKFKTGQTNVVRLVKNEFCNALYYNIDKAHITYLGNGVTLKTENHHAEHTKSTKNSTFVFDGVILNNNGGAFQPAANCALVLRNGARMDFKMSANSGTFTLDIGYGCAVNGSNFSMNGTGNTMIVDDGLAVGANEFSIGQNSKIIIKGDRPAIQARQGITAKNCYLDFYLPKTPYGEETANSSAMWLARAPLRKNYINDNSTHSLEGSTININRRSPVRSCSGTREFLLFDARSTSYAASSGIVTNGLQFTGLNAGEYVYYKFDSTATANPTRIYLHLKGGSGLKLWIR